MAYILHHESVHFSRLVSVGWSTKEEEELIAYAGSQTAAKYFGLEEDQTAFIRKKHRQYFVHSWLPIYPLGPASHWLFHDEKDDAPNKVEFLFQEEQGRMIREAERFVSNESGTRSDATAALVVIHPEKPSAAQHFDARAAAAQLASLAKAACIGANQKAAEITATVNRWFPDERSSLPISDWMGLSGCSYDMYIWIREKNAMARGYQLHPGEIVLAAKQYERENAAPARALVVPAPGSRSKAPSRHEEPACSVQSGVRGCPR